MKLALVISKVTTPIFMGVTHFLVLAPVGLFMRLMGRNPMIRNPAGGFWVARHERAARRGDLKRQF